MLNHGVLVGEQWNDEAETKAYEQAGGKPGTPVPPRKARRTGRLRFRSPIRPKAAKTGDTDAANVEIGWRCRRYGRRARIGRERMRATQSNAIKVIALSAASIALLSACGEPKATPMDDEYAGNSGESVQSQEEKSKTAVAARRPATRRTTRRPKPCRREFRNIRQAGHRQLRGWRLFDQRPVRAGRRRYHRRASDR